MFDNFSRYRAACMQLLHKYVQIRSCIYLTSSSQIQLLSTKINTYTCNPHDRKTLWAHERPLHETKENVMKTFQFVSSFRREEETRMNARDTVAECFATLASQVSF
jgi:hypothetical protein